MSIHAALYTYLSGVAGIQSVLGTTPRLYPGNAPTSAAVPYATFSRVLGVHEHHTLAAAGLAHCVVQIDCWDDDSVGAQSVAEALRVALDGMTTKTWGSVAIKRVLLVGERDLFEAPDDGSQEGLFRVSMEFEIWYAESVPAL